MPNDEGSKPDGIVIAHDWWEAGWDGILPRQALWLHMVIATATARRLDGNIDHLVDSIGRDAFVRHTGGLDGPLWWSFPDEEPDDQQLAMDRARETTCRAVLTAAGLATPLTVRDLALLMAKLGIFERRIERGVERWRQPEALPLPAERLPVPAEFAAEEDQRRWRSVHERAAQAIIRHVIECLDSPDEVSTSVLALARAAGIDPADARFGLAVLIDDGDFSLLAANGYESADPEIVDESASVILRVDWDNFGENRIGIQGT